MTSQKLPKLKRKYQELVEQAYNLKYTDPSLSDYAQFKANKVLAKLHFLMRSPT